MDNSKLSNKEIRQWYHTEIAKIPELNEQWIADGVSVEDRAFRAWKFRRDKRLAARALMQDEKDVVLAENRDLKKYGTTDGPTFDFKLNEAINKGLTGNAVYEYIIKGSVRTDAEVDKKILE